MSRDEKTTSGNDSILKPAKFGSGTTFGSSSTASSVLAPSRLSGNPFLSSAQSEKTGSSGLGILRPSSLAAHAANIKPTNVPDKKGEPAKIELLKPATLQNPLAGASRSREGSPKANGLEKKKRESTSENYFAQFVQSSAQPAESGSEGAGGFVFGQNLADRVTANPPPAADDQAEEKEAEETALEKPDDTPKAEDASDEEANTSGSGQMTLEQSAKAYQARHKQQTYGEVEVITGEEDESNVLRVSCNLYVFDKDNQTWLERGRGVLHLNDMKDEASKQLHSRLIMRLQGSLKVVLNAALWSDMMVDRASQRSLRITAPDAEGNVRIYLFKASLGHAEQLYRAILTRVQQLRASDEADAPEAAEAAANPAAEAAGVTPTSPSSAQPGVPQKRPAEGGEDAPEVKKPRSDNGGGQTETEDGAKSETPEASSKEAGSAGEASADA